VEPFAIITPSRDRPKMFSFCIEQLNRQEVQPTNRYYMNIPPVDSQPDLIRRIRNGIELAQRDGIDIVYIIEDDDQYPSNYFELMEIGDNDFIGFSDTYYYSLSFKTWRHQYHNTRQDGPRSSLFCTGFRISALKDFRWPPDHYLWLDIKLWEYARDSRKKVKLMENNPCLGIKGHGEGMHAGKSHRLTFEHLDRDLTFLEKRTEPYQFEFYKNWINAK